MSKYEVFRNRMKADGNTYTESLINRTKRVETRRFLGSPTLSYVDIEELGKDVPTIISEDDRVLKKRFLFLPDTEIKVGMIVHQRDKGNKYLALQRSDDDIYPQLFAELCNHDFEIRKTERILTGHTPQGRPIYEDFVTTEMVPSVLYTNVYSTLSNVEISLPSGALIVRIPYKDEYAELIQKNDEYEMNTGKYIVTEVDLGYVVYGKEGFLEVTLQRKVE